MARYELTEFEWKTIQPLLPNKPRGVPRVDDRRVLNGIFWILRSGCQSARKCDPISASNFDPFERRGRVVALAPSELVGVAETARARVV